MLKIVYGHASHRLLIRNRVALMLWLESCLATMPAVQFVARVIVAISMVRLKIKHKHADLELK